MSKIEYHEVTCPEPLMIVDAETGQDRAAGEIVALDPAQTNIRALIQAKLIKAETVTKTAAAKANQDAVPKE